MTTTRNTDEVIEVLRGHWVTNHWIDETDPQHPGYCVVGAACKAFHDQPEWFEEVTLPEGYDTVGVLAYEDESDLEADMTWFAGLADFLANYFTENGLVPDDHTTEGEIDQFWNHVERWQAGQKDPLPVIYQWNDSLAQTEEHVIEMLTDYESWRQERKHVADIHADAKLYGYE